MVLEPFDIFGWVATFVGHTILIALLLYRNRYKDFSSFSALIGFCLLRTAVLVVVHLRFNASFFSAYWALAGVDEALNFAIVYQVASMVFRPAGAWARDVKTSLWITVGFSIAIASALAYLATPSTFAQVQSLIVRGKFMSAVLMLELFVGIMTLSVRVGLPWRSHVTHICHGLAAYSVFCVFLDTAIAVYGIHAGSPLYKQLSHLRIIGYLITLCYWIIMLLRRAPGRERMPETLRRQMGVLQQQLDADIVRLRTLSEQKRMMEAP